MRYKSKVRHTIFCDKCGCVVPDPLYIDRITKKPVCDDCHRKEDKKDDSQN